MFVKGKVSMNKSEVSVNKFRYNLDDKGCFVIDHYNNSEPFSNFFPGIAGIWGIPMWVFYVNRGQCIASFGIENKDKAMMEFQPANKAYRLATLHGFRTFIKVQEKDKAYYWEPFQDHLRGTEYQKDVTMKISAEDLTLEEVNTDLGLKVVVNYFTMPEESYPALIRRVKIINESSKDYEIEIVDGLPMIMPYGMKDWLVKNLSRTIEAWIKVRSLKEKTPYYQLNVEVSDKPEVTHITEGNFFFSFRATGKKKLLEPIVEAACVFGKTSDFITPTAFLNEQFTLPCVQNTSNRTPSAMSYDRFGLKAGKESEIISLYGYAKTEERLKPIVDQVMADDFIDQKAALNKKIIFGIKNFVFTKSSSEEFNMYSSQTFLDNILRGGLPVSIKTNHGYVAFNVFSRKHGDLERDYNYFNLASTYFSQGNGNYRDVSQNRRNDVWFNTDVSDNHLINFLNLSQADGYNPLVVKGATFSFEDENTMEQVLKKCVKGKVPDDFRDFLRAPFMPGDLLNKVNDLGIELSVAIHDFLGMVLESCYKQELAEHNEGFWSDHWTYNLDLVESYVGLYPEKFEDLLLNKKEFSFYHNSHYVLPIDKRYILTDKGVRQYEALAKITEGINPDQNGNVLKTKGGAGTPYKTNLLTKILCLIANKISTLDPSGIGVAMEADKPNWYDALNGLPGLLGSSISETYEIKRLSLFLLNALIQLSLDNDKTFPIFEELSTFIKDLAILLSKETEAYPYWRKSNEVKEHYRNQIRFGIEGKEEELAIKDIKDFLKLVIDKTNQSIQLAKDEEGFLSTYFTHDVTAYDQIDIGQGKVREFVLPKKFVLNKLPAFLEGYVHALKIEKDSTEAKKLYEAVRKSDLYDKKLKMYKVNADLSKESEEIGRTRIFPRSWLENESIWLHMEYKFMLELLRSNLYAEFYANFRNVLVPFLKPETYNRSILENSSFIVSSAHEDKSLHGQGFVARLSGSTAEFLHIWLFMNVGLKPFALNKEKQLELSFSPILEGNLFTTKETKVEYTIRDEIKSADLPKDSYAFNFLGSILVVYHNPQRKNTFGDEKATIKKIQLIYVDSDKPIELSTEIIPSPYAQDIRDKTVGRIDIYFE